MRGNRKILLIFYARHMIVNSEVYAGCRESYIFHIAQLAIDEVYKVLGFAVKSIWIYVHFIPISDVR